MGRGWVKTLFLFPRHVVPSIAYRTEAGSIPLNRYLDSSSFLSGRTSHRGAIMENVDGIREERRGGRELQGSSSSKSRSPTKGSKRRR